MIKILWDKKRALKWGILILLLCCFISLFMGLSKNKKVYADGNSIVITVDDNLYIDTEITSSDMTNLYSFYIYLFYEDPSVSTINYSEVSDISEVGSSYYRASSGDVEKTGNKGELEWRDFYKPNSSDIIKAYDLPTGNYYVVIKCSGNTAFFMYAGAVYYKTEVNQITEASTKVGFSDQSFLASYSYGEVENYIFKCLSSNDEGNAASTKYTDGTGAWVTKNLDAFKATKTYYSNYYQVAIRVYNETAQTLFGWEQILYGKTYPSLDDVNIGILNKDSEYKYFDGLYTINWEDPTPITKIYDESLQPLAVSYDKEDVDVVTHYADMIYNVKFDGNGATSGSMDDINDVVMSSTWSLPKNTYTLEDYDFAGWSLNKDATTATYLDEASVSLLSKTNKSTVTLYAIWTPKSRNVIVHLNDGTDDVKKISFPIGNTITIDTTQFTREHYTFKQFTETVPETMGDEDINLTIEWTPVKYKLYLYMDEEKKTCFKELEFAYDSSIDLSIVDDPAKTGYKFVSWNETVPNKMPGNDVEYYAIWKAKTYTLTYFPEIRLPQKVYQVDYNDPLPNPPEVKYLRSSKFVKWDTEIPTTMPDHDLTIRGVWEDFILNLTVVYGNGFENQVIKIGYDETIADYLKEPVIEQYTFEGWEETIPETMPDHDLTIHAKLKKITYKVLFVDAQEGKTIGYELSYGDAIVEPKVYKTHYHFSGWNNTVPKTMPASNLEFKANWTIDRFTIYFDTDGGSAISPISFDYQEKIVINVSTKKSGYDFVSWDQELPSIMPDHNITLKAIWNARKFQVQYFVDDEVYHTDYYIIDEPITLYNVDPNKEDCSFIGWDKKLPAVMDGKDYEVHAVFSKISFRVQFISNCDTTYEDIIVLVSQKIAKVVDPVKIGYTFEGWFLDEEFTIPFDFNQPIYSNTKLYAKFTLNATVNKITNDTKDCHFSIRFSEGIDEMTELVVTVYKNEELEEATKSGTFLIDYSRYMGPNSAIGAIYNLKLMLHGKQVNYDNMEVTFVIPEEIREKRLVLYHVIDEENFELIEDYVVIDGTIYLKCNELNEFALFYYMDKKVIDNTKRNVILIVGGITIVGLTTLTIYLNVHLKKMKKKRQDDWLADI